MKKIILTGWIAIVSVASGWGWGSDGHRVIAALAFTHLNSNAQFAITAILNSDEIKEVTTLPEAATWPDDIRNGGKHHHTAAASNFLARFPKHEQWHYVNYPLNGPSYTLGGTFSRPDDIVHQIRFCIDVLQQPPGAAMRKEEALAYLVHLVGDLHQPLHVACGYYTLNSQNIAHLEANPAKPHDARHERGGNGLRWSGGTTNSQHNFHSFWDNDMVSTIGSTEPLLFSRLAVHWQNMGLVPDAGEIKLWPRHWATDSIAKARAVYFNASGRVGTPGTDKNDPAQGTVEIQIDIHLPTYKLAHKVDAMDQLTKAAFHLAVLLNKIHWN